MPEILTPLNIEYYVVDNNVDVGMYSSIACDNNNQLHFSYYDNIDKNLKYATGTDNSYQLQVIAEEGDVGKYTSIVIDNSDNINIIYYDASRGKLKYAGWLRTWEYDTIDSTGDVGQYSSITMNTSNEASISYYDATNDDLKVASFNGISWDKQIVDTANDRGKYTSYLIDSDNNPNLIYYDATKGKLKYAGWLRTWEYDTIDSTGDVGQYSSITMNTSNEASISYYDATNDDLKVASFNGISWDKQIVDTANDRGKYTSYLIDSDNNPNLIYYDATKGKLKYAGWLRTWEYDTVDSDGDVGQYNSIACDAYNQLHISYYDVTNADLKFASYDGTVWQKDTITSAGSVGKYTSLSFSNHENGNNGWVIYYDQTEGELKCANKQFDIPGGYCEYVDAPEGHYAYDAISYLCYHYMLDNDGWCEPQYPITRAALAKLAYLSINLQQHPYADDFPSPFQDLQDESTWYYTYAKNLSYLEYQDGIAPFDKTFFNFYASNHISRAHTLKVLLETWNVELQTGTVLPFTDVDPTHDAYEYIYTAYQLGIIEDNDQHIFGPDVNAYRGEVFVMLYKIMSTLALPIPAPTLQDFFVPGNYTPENFASFKAMHSGNFNFYKKTSFAISSIGIPLNFEHTYNSYLTEMPNSLTPIKPLGKAWNHPYNSYIMEVPGDLENPGDFRVVIAMPNGGFNVYKLINGAYVCETKGIYNILEKPTPDKFTLTSKNQIVYTYQKMDGSADDFPYVLKTVHDRNGNTLSIHYEVSAYKDGFFRISHVTGTAGRNLNFNYYPNTDLISHITDPINRTVYFDYDTYDVIHEEPKLVSFKDAKNQFTYYGYGTNELERFLLLTIQLPKGNIITNTYEQKKLISSKTNGNQPTTFAYIKNYGQSGNQNYNQTVKTNPLGLITTTNYNKNGDAHHIKSNVYTVDIDYDPIQSSKPSHINIDGKNIGYTYDAMGNLLSMNLELGVSHQFQYNEKNDVTEYINPRQKSYTYTYDQKGNLVSSSTPRGTVTYSHNSNGLIVLTTNPEGIAISNSYDTFGNIISTNAPEAISTTSTYDLASRITSFTNPNGKTISYQYDANSNLLQETFNIQSTIYDYDANSNLTTVTNAMNGVTTMIYDFQNDFLNSVSFGGNSDVYSYESDGRLISHTNSNLNTISNSYDTLGRLQSITTGLDNVLYGYDNRNNIISVSNLNGTIEFVYDDLNRVTQSTDFWGNEINYTYDLSSNLISIEYAINKTVTYTYDDDNLMHSVSDWNGNTTYYTYRADGKLLHTSYPNGTYLDYMYDNAGRMIGMSWKKSDDSVINAYTYVLDPNGNHITEEKTEPYGPTGFQTQNVSYTYNNVNRIITAGGTSYGFDANGNTISKGNNTYQYDEFNRLTSISGDLNTQYLYDGNGNRRSATVNGIIKRYVLDLKGISKILVEIDGSNNPQNYYIYGLGLIARIDTGNQTHYFHYDYRGSTIAMTDVNESITHQYQYDDFGHILQSLEADNNSFKYAGQHGVTYEDTNFYFMRARYYDAEIGRFISEDPIWSTNLYLYAENNPILGIDPKGENIIEDGVSLYTGVKSVYNTNNSNLERTTAFGFLAKDAIGVTHDIIKAGEVSKYLQNGFKLKNLKVSSLSGSVSKAGIAGIVLSGGVNIYSNYQEGLGAQSIPKALIQTGIGAITFGLWDGEEVFDFYDKVGTDFGRWLPQYKTYKVFTEEDILQNMNRNNHK